MIKAKEYQPQQVKRVYNHRSWIYSKTAAPREWTYHLMALDQAGIRPDEKVLEVAVGPGLTFLELARRAGKDTMLYGIDISTSMLQLTERRLRSHGFSQFQLKEGSARQLPFEEKSFDVLYNGYMLDLIPEKDMPGILAEFKRVLKPGGRMVLLNMSKPDDQVATLWEKVYQFLPPTLVLYMMGGCRPVLMEQPARNAGFIQVQRTFIGGKAPSEIILAKKPLAENQVVEKAG